MWAGNLVGKGGYAKVFRGVLKNGQLIAVKKHNRGDTAAGKERDFLIELGIVSHVSHTNVAKLMGICIENGLHLVFQFSTLGSLQPLLHRKCAYSAINLNIFQIFYCVLSGNYFFASIINS